MLWCSVYLRDSCMLLILAKEDDKGALLSISGLLAEIWGHFPDLYFRVSHTFMKLRYKCTDHCIYNVLAKELIRILFVKRIYQTIRALMNVAEHVFKCLLTFVLITSAGEDDADTWMMSMIHVLKGVEVCDHSSLK